jgi:hypothetical protein
MLGARTPEQIRRDAKELELFEALEETVKSDFVLKQEPEPTPVSIKLEQALRQWQVLAGTADTGLAGEGACNSELLEFMMAAKHRAPGFAKGKAFVGEIEELVRNSNADWGPAVLPSRLDVEHADTCLCAFWNLFPVGLSANLDKSGDKLCASMTAGVLVLFRNLLGILMAVSVSPALAHMQPY